MATRSAETAPSFLPILEARFRALGVGTSNADRAAYLETDPATYSRVINGRTRLTRNRAKDWANRLASGDLSAAGEIESQLLASTPQSARVRMTVDEFCNGVVREGGAVGAIQITDLFEALEPSDAVRDPVVLIEYSDLPRAAPDAKYQSLAHPLAQAVARGVNVGMLFPFKLPNKSQLTGTSEAVKYMARIYDECKKAYMRFARLAADVPEANVSDIKKRLRMYIAGDVPETATPSFQSKLLYIQWDDNKEERHHRIFQWVSSPPEDWLVYRGDHVEPKAVRDAFFPIPHAFGLEVQEGATRTLPTLNPDNWKYWKSKLEVRWPELGERCLWRSDD